MAERPPVLRASLLRDNELVVDLFAGGGGASTGIARALGRDPDVAINHSPQAIAMHKANHPATEHHLCSVWEADPVAVCRGRAVGLLWLSPDCTHHSRAAGRKPKCRKRRALASVAITWARTVRPRVIVLENVEEWLQWGPLDNKGQPIKAKAGRSFRNWLGKLRARGYRVEWRSLVAADYGAPTTRRRLFLIARCDGEPIVWPAPTHARGGRGGLAPWRGAHEVIDWSDTGQSIFDREKPLVEKTMRRIAAGIRRYVLESGRPFVVPITHAGDPARVHSIDDPLRTVTTAPRGEFALVTPFTARVDMHKSNATCAYDVRETPLHTVTTAHGGGHAVIAPVLATYHGGERGDARGQTPVEPLPTADTSNRFAVVVPHLSKFYGTSTGAEVDGPVPTVTGQGQHLALVGATLVANYGERPTQAPRAADPSAPLGAVVADAKHAVVTAWVAKNFGGVVGQQAELLLGAVTAIDHHALVTAHAEAPGAAPPDRREQVRAFLIAYYGATESAHMQQQSLLEPLATVPTRARFALVTINGVAYEIVDIRYRMLKPRELARAHDFDAEYVLDPPADVVLRGKRVRRPLTVTEQIECIGNSVPPPFAEAIVRANLGGGERAREVA